MRNAHVTLGYRLYWLVEGWRIFTKQPFTWIAMSSLYMSVGFAVLLLPIVGTLAIALAWPALTAGLIHGANEVSHDRKLQISHLFEIFRHRELIRSLLVFGAFLAGLVVAHTGFSMFLWSKGIFDNTLPAIAALTSALIISSIMFHAIPAAVIGKTTPLRAIKDSIVTSAMNIPTLLLFAVTYPALLVLALIPHGLGLVVLIPITAGAMHTYYLRVSAECGNEHTSLACDVLRTDQYTIVSKPSLRKRFSFARDLSMAVLLNGISSDGKDKRR